MNAQEKTLWEQATQILRQNTVTTTQRPGREKQVLAKTRGQAVWQRSAA